GRDSGWARGSGSDGRTTVSERSPARGARARRDLVPAGDPWLHGALEAVTSPMTNEPNAHAAAPPAAPDAPERELSLRELAKERWWVGVRRDRLDFVPPDERTPRVLDHQTFVAKTKLHFGLLGTTLSLTEPLVRFKLEPADVAALRAWLDPV